MEGNCASMEITKEKPRLYLRDNQIEDCLGKGVESFKIGDVVTMTAKFRVSSVDKSENEDYDYSKDGKRSEKPKIVTRKRVDLELIESSKDNIAEGKAKMQMSKGVSNA